MLVSPMLPAAMTGLEPPPDAPPSPPPSPPPPWAMTDGVAVEAALVELVESEPAWRGVRSSLRGMSWGGGMVSLEGGGEMGRWMGRRGVGLLRGWLLRLGR